MVIPRTTSVPPARLPLPLTSFVGRQAELEALRRLFGAGGRLVSLLGPPGAGKTRVALELCRDAGEALGLEGGAVFVDCSDARDVEGLERAVANVFAISLAAHATPAAIEERLCQAMEARGKSLVVLDNFEQLIQVAAGSVARWLELAPSTSFLVTSRERIVVPGERTFDLPPLPLPSTSDDIRSVDSVVLFVERARAVRASYEPTPAELLSIAEICRELDGLPLALELAGARMRAMSPEQILARLGARLDFLVDRANLSNPRHATLASAIWWSWELLTATEREALAQCALFRGGFDLEGAEAVVRLPEGPETVADVVESLLDKSLLVLLEPRTGSLRFGLLASIQQFAQARLDESGSRAALQARCIAYFSRFGDAWVSRLDTTEGAEARARLQVELENLLEAHGAAVASRDSNASLALGLAIGSVAIGRGPIATGIRCLDEALAERDELSADARKTVEAHLLRGRLRLIHGTPVEAASDFRAAAERAEAFGDSVLTCVAFERLGTTARIQGDVEAAEAALSSALALATKTGDALSQSRVLCALALARSRSHPEADYVEANLLPMLREAVSLARAAGSRRVERAALANLGHLEASAGRDDDAREHVRAAVAIRDAGHHVRTFLNTGALLQLGDQPAEAAEAYRDALGAARVVGDRPAEVTSLAWLGVALSELGREADARAALDEALVLVDRRGDRTGRAFVLAFRASFEGREGRPDPGSWDLTEAKKVALGADSLARWELDAVLDLAAGILEAAEAERASRRGADEAAADLRASARRRLVGHLRGTSGPSDRLAWPVAVRWCSLDVRLQVRALCKILDAAPAGPLPRAEIVVARDATWFVLPGTRDRVSLARRGPLRRVFASLVEGRSQRRGEPLSVDELLAAAWPGEKMQREAGAARVYATISRLRRMGLQGVVVSRDDGYVIDPSIDVRLADE